MLQVLRNLHGLNTSTDKDSIVMDMNRELYMT